LIVGIGVRFLSFASVFRGDARLTPEAEPMETRLA